ncbi:MAG: hypothetical protein EBX41_10880 [Chitinophagia bacterium]|nr:hypothetical protein [Chitinophagia bacterium]
MRSWIKIVVALVLLVAVDVGRAEGQECKEYPVFSALKGAEIVGCPVVNNSLELPLGLDKAKSLRVYIRLTAMNMRRHIVLQLLLRIMLPM